MTAAVHSMGGMSENEEIPTKSWAESGFNRTAPVEVVVEFLGEENRDTPVTIGMLRQIAAMNDAQWESAGDWKLESDVNTEALGVESSPPIIPPKRRYRPRTELTGGIWESGLT